MHFQFPFDTVKKDKGTKLSNTPFILPLSHDVLRLGTNIYTTIKGFVWIIIVFYSRLCHSEIFKRVGFNFSFSQNFLLVSSFQSKMSHSW